MQLSELNMDEAEIKRQALSDLLAEINESSPALAKELKEKIQDYLQALADVVNQMQPDE